MDFKDYLTEAVKRKFVTKSAQAEYEDSLKKKRAPGSSASAPSAKTIPLIKNIKDFTNFYYVNMDSLYAALGFDSEREAENETGEDTDYDFSTEVPIFIERKDSSDITGQDLKNIKSYLRTISKSSKVGNYENISFSTSDKPGSAQIAVNVSLT